MKALAKIFLILICTFSLLTSFASCGKSNDNGAKCDHTFGEWEMYEDGECDKRTFKRTCSVCTNTEWKQGTEEDHKYGSWERVEPTCIESGGEIRTCGECGKRDVKNEVAATKKHRADDNGVCIYCGSFITEKYDVIIWIPNEEGMYELYTAQIEDFMREYPQYDINFAIGIIDPMEVGGQVANDVACAPDLYVFSPDYLQTLVVTDALSALDGDMADRISASNDKASVVASSLGDNLYAYPLSSNNGYYMFYDKSVITNPDSLEQIIYDCEAAGKRVVFQMDAGFFNASFFLATGCVSEWTVNADGYFDGVHDTYNSPAGLEAMKAMSRLAKSSCFDNEMRDYSNIGVFISGMWDLNRIQESLGSNFAATDLPSFTVDDKEYHMGSYSDHHLLGVKPQKDENKEAMLHLLAEYLTSFTCQMDRLYEFGLTPSNLSAQRSETIQSDTALSAFVKQLEYATPRRAIPGGWWAYASDLGYCAMIYTYTDDLSYALDEYEMHIKSILN